ncbi:MAG: hypothetical protein QG568_485 [Patescibacteria group bacterium]|nr:hypothetical protein [Patescibacteria group bacterium]
MIFDLICENHAGKITFYGHVVANSPEEAAAGPLIGYPIASSTETGRHTLYIPSTGHVSSNLEHWYLQETKPLRTRPPELDR